jgi:LL-diaminopimelate aminotransferase
VVEFASKYRILVIHDNAYSEVAFDGSTHPAFYRRIAPRSLVWSSIRYPKHNMTGWRIGFAVEMLKSSPLWVR